MTALLPWQEVTVGSGLLLAAASDISVDVTALQRQTRAAIDSTPDSDRGRYGDTGGDWTAITLMIMPLPDGDGSLPAGTPAPPLAHLPLLEKIFQVLGRPPHGAHILRQPPRGLLPWHFDPQALHLPLCRLLLTVEADPAAFTWIGHEKVAFPAGTLWTGDFAIPHQVENDSDRERLVIALDYPSTDQVRARFPAPLTAEAGKRASLSGQAVNLWRDWRFAQAS